MREKVAEGRMRGGFCDRLPLTLALSLRERGSFLPMAED